jgi:integrase
MNAEHESPLHYSFYLDQFELVESSGTLVRRTGPLFPYLRSVRSGDRATEFKQRCNGLGIKGVSLHSYRYAWAERAKTAGYPERYAQVNLGHNSRAMARAYSRKVPVEMPSLSEYERQQKTIIGNRNTEPAAKAVAA